MLRSILAVYQVQDLFVTVIEVVTVTLIKNVIVIDVKAVNMIVTIDKDVTSSRLQGRQYHCHHVIAN